MVDTIAGYRLDALIGRGSTGTVWRARREGPMGQTVAVKRVASTDAGSVGELRREAEVLADLDHPHVIALLDLIEDPPGLALVMPLARGGSMRHLLDECGTLAAGALVGVLAPVADALASAHRRGVVHGDVKPANVLFTSDGEPLLADFGVARRLGAPVVTHLPVRGTATYLDPALLDGRAPDGSADVYALGVVAYEALTGRPPHRGAPAEVLAAAAAGAHRPVCASPAVPRRLAELVDEAMRTDPTARPTAAELAAGLRAAVDPAAVILPGPALHHHVEVDDDGTRPFGPRPPAPVPPSSSRRRWPVLVAAAVTVLVVAAAWWGPARRATSAAVEREAPATADGRPEPPRTRACPAVATARRGDLPPSDLDGDGCPDQAWRDGHLLVTRLSRDGGRHRAFRVGEVGDRLLLGDWDCDGVASPALYRPATGEVLYASGLTRGVGDRVYAARVERRVRGGRPRRVVVPGGCDEVRVTSAGRNGDDGR